MARRSFSVFNLSFLDCICCGFGAVLLLFVIVNARSGADVPERSDVPDLSSEVNRLKDEVLQGRKNLVLARNTFEETTNELAVTEGLSRQVIETLEEKKEELAQYEKDTLAKVEHINRLKADIQSMEKDKKRLEGGQRETPDTGLKIRQFVGDGQRQYLTGIKVGGKRILILVDASASMLGTRLVDILIRRNLPDDDKRRAAKWRQSLRTVDWITAQFPEDARYQIVTFNETAAPVLDGTAGTWLRASDIEQLNAAVKALREMVPDKGTSLHHAFRAIKTLEPAPDSVFLLTDGLPTMKDKPGFRKQVSGRERASFFRSAMGIVPRGVPVNVILFPMEGDPQAPSAFWVLAKETGGSFITPSEDWP